MSGDMKLALHRAKRSGGKLLDLSGLQLQEIPNDIYSSFPALQELNLAENKLISVDSALFSSFKDLKVLNLAANSIAFLPAEVRDAAKRGVTIKLHKNPITLKYPSLASSGPAFMKAAEEYFTQKSEGLVKKKSTASFLHDEGEEDVEALRQKITDLSLEISRLKAQEETKTPGLSKTMSAALFDDSSLQVKVGRLEAQNSNLKREVAELHADFKGSAGGMFSKISDLMEVGEKEIKLGKQIAQGGFSVAVKKIFDPVITEELKEEMENEVRMLHYLRHPNIVLLMGVNPDLSNIMIVTELVSNGTLFDLLHGSGKEVPLKKRTAIAFEIALTYKFMHDAGVVHRDVKSYNVLLDNQLHVKICDFGLARFKRELNRGTQQFSGTPAYMSPEMFQRKSYDESVDVFSFGTLLWEIVTREVPFDGIDPGDVRNMVLAGKKLECSFGVDKKIAELIHGCRNVEPALRPNFTKIVEVLRTLL